MVTRAQTQRAAFKEIFPTVVATFSGGMQADSGSPTEKESGEQIPQPPSPASLQSPSSKC